MVYKEITACRICGNDDLLPVLDLGVQCLSGVFPRTAAERVPSAPLQLVKCGRDEKHGCGLIQLRHTCSLSLLYGQGYGYRSGLNQSMVRHLQDLVAFARARVDLRPGDLVLDIGSNDGTLLGFYPHDAGLQLLGLDPAGEKWKALYRDDVLLSCGFFSEARVRSVTGAAQARIVTSIAMFYDLEAPLEFVRDVANLLADDGIWVFEQSYLPRMLDATAYDTVCHEHLEYYSLRQILWLLERAGLHIVALRMSDTNGGSFIVAAARKRGPHRPCDELTSGYLAEERRRGIYSPGVYRDFAKRIENRRLALCTLLDRLAGCGTGVFGYGASTKGNVLLQYCGIDSTRLPCIADVNPDKYGCYTPGTGIPIVSEEAAKSMAPGCFMVLPWHFREPVIEREKAFLDAGGRLLFPLPRVEMVPAPPLAAATRQRISNAAANRGRRIWRTTA